MKIRFTIAILLLLIIYSYSQEPLIVAHRGASHDAPENTIPAFELAWQKNADAIEGDFYLTTDGKIVCFHDGNLKRVTGVDLEIKDCSYDQLRDLDAGAWKDEKFKGTRIPTLKQVLDVVPDGKMIYIEIKCGSEIIPAMLKEIEKSGLKDEQIVIISFNESVIKAMREKAPQFKANWLSGFDEDDDGVVTPTLESVLATLNEIKATGFSSSHKLIDKDFIDAFKKTGYEYHVWTVDDTDIANRFKSWGAGSITTNRPEYIRENLNE